jgi:farnesyl diphosphate synthase
MPSVVVSAFEPALAFAAESTDRTMDRLLPRGASDEARVFERCAIRAWAGGKRLRAFFVLAAPPCSRSAPCRRLRVASAIEFVHAYSLIHDDLPAMDDDALRRGKPTCHKQFDEATAILAGDALQALAFEVLAHEDTHGDPAVRAHLVAELARGRGRARHGGRPDARPAG